MLWIELDLKSFFGGEGPSITLPQKREFTLDNIHMCNKFLEELKTIHTHQRLPQRIQLLEKEFIIFGSTPERIRQYNALDRELVDSIKAALTRTVKQKQHGYSRSPALTSAGTAVLFWKSVLSAKRTDRELSQKALNLAERIDRSN